MWLEDLCRNYLEGYHIPYLHPGLMKGIRMGSYRVAVQQRVVTHHVDTRESSVRTVIGLSLGQTRRQHLCNRIRVLSRSFRFTHATAPALSTSICFLKMLQKKRVNP